MKPAYIFRPNTLYLGDCLEVMQSFVDAGMQVDLIYLDPPFNSNADYSMLFKQDKRGQDLNEQAQFFAFRDTWHWTPTAATRMANLKNAIDNPARKVIVALDAMMPETPMLAYLSYMTERIVLMHRLLKDTGSLYLHCDQTANSYLRMILGMVFGAENLRNEIIWRKTNSPKPQSKTFGAQHDTIFLCSKSDKFTFNVICKKPDEDYLKSYRQQDERGRYQTVALSNKTSLGGFGKMKVWEWRGVSARWIYSKENLDQWWDEDKIVKTNGGYRKKVYLHEVGGPVVSDIWVDKEVNPIQSREKTGYPTQKPIALLERIVKASSNEGDLVLDPFCGCGTTAAASFKLKRKFLGIDISAYVLRQVCVVRLQDAPGVEVHGLPTDMSSAAELAARDPFKFEEWAVSCLPGLRPNEKQTGDGGVDGQGIMLVKPVKDGEAECGVVVAQVKGGGFTPDAYRALLGKIAVGKASAGLFITLNKQKITPSMNTTIVDAGDYTLPGGARKWQRMIFWSIEEYFAGQYPLLPELADPTSGKPMPRQIPLTEKTADK